MEYIIGIIGIGIIGIIGIIEIQTKIKEYILGIY